MENNRNFFITIAASVLILTLWQVFYMNPRVEQQRETARIEAQRQSENKPAAGTATPSTQAQQPGAVPNASGADATTPAGRDQALAASQRVKIDTPSAAPATVRRHPPLFVVSLIPASRTVLIRTRRDLSQPFAFTNLPLEEAAVIASGRHRQG